MPDNFDRRWRDNWSSFPCDCDRNRNRWDNRWDNRRDDRRDDRWDRRDRNNNWPWY